ncbi:MAG: DUF3592 domain-containing protein [Acutalibacteraceae bacterium]|jgi:hypothetical protein
MKKGTIFQALFRIMGIIVLILGIRMVGEGIYNYIDENNQKDWVSTTAYVIDISSEYSSSRHNRGVDYDITYQYEVDGNKYSDKLYNRSRPMGLGDEINIKYDPDAPKNSTDILVPSVKNLIVFLAFGAILITIGFFLSGTWALIRKLRRSGKPEEEEILPPEEYVKPEEMKRNTRSPFLTITIRIIVIVVVLGGTILSIKLFSGIHPIETGRFLEITSTAGYTATDTTAELSQSWKVGSMLKQAYSFNDGNIRMDFVVMDAADSARALFNSMTLPVSEGDMKESGGTVHELYSIENETVYVAKIRISDTVLYVSAQAEYKPKAEALLKELGYWKE